MASRPYQWDAIEMTHAMPEYDVVLYYTGFLLRTVQADNEQSAILKAREELNAPCNRATFVQRFEPIIETLVPCYTGDRSRLITRE
jgi:hypothetical protein